MFIARTHTNEEYSANVRLLPIMNYVTRKGLRLLDFNLTLPSFTRDYFISFFIFVKNKFVKILIVSHFIVGIECTNRSMY